jgi:ergothioneine biosynthesis protein EgtB
MLQQLLNRFIQTRRYSEELTLPLLIEDYSVQPSEFTSPPKWHLAHVTWFWEEFILTKYANNYKVYDEDFSFLFNSYYNNAGKRVLRPVRGLMTRPPVQEIYQYRNYVTDAMVHFLASNPSEEVLHLINVGINHEEQHQELFVYDIKYILGNQPTFPMYGGNLFMPKTETMPNEFISIDAGIYEIGHSGAEFCFDNELGRHKVYIAAFEISSTLITNAAFIEFINAGGYANFDYWHDEGWQWVNNNNINAPLYWHLVEGEWHTYTLAGLQKINLAEPVIHVSYFEAWAYAEWKKMRLPTEAEWEVAADKLKWGQVWEWTNSAYLAYPGFSKAAGALGEYNGKFMINTMVLRGGSVATPVGHSRKTYRNFFHPAMRWQYCGIRLVK